MQAAYVKVVHDGHVYGPIYSKNLLASDLFAMIDVDVEVYQLLRIDGTPIMPNEHIEAGIYEFVPLLFTKISRRSTKAAKSRVETLSLSMIKRNLENCIDECRQISKVFRFNKDKHETRLRKNMDQLKEIDEILESEYLHETSLIQICKALKVEFEHILHENPPFYTRAHAKRELKPAYLNMIRDEQMSVKIKPMTTSDLRRAKINYMKSLIEIQVTKETDWLNMLDVTLKTENYIQGGLRGSSKCHGSFHLFETSTAESMLRKEFKLSPSDK